MSAEGLSDVQSEAIESAHWNGALQPKTKRDADAVFRIAV